MIRLVIIIFFISFSACKQDSKSKSRNFGNKETIAGVYTIENDLGRSIILADPKLEKVISENKSSQALEYKICIKKNGSIAYLEIVGAISDLDLVREVAQILREYRFNTVTTPDEECGRIRLSR